LDQEGRRCEETLKGTERLGKPAFDRRITFSKINYEDVCVGYFQLVKDRDKKWILVKMTANSRVP